MNKITIGFSKPKGKFKILSWLIRWIQKTEYSHSYLVFNSAIFPDIKMVYQSNASGVNYISLDSFLEANSAIYTKDIELSDENYLNIRKWCMLNAGKHYSFWQLINIATQPWGIRLFKNDRDNKQICSEVVARALHSAGIQWDKPLDLVTPKDIYEKIQILH